MPKTKVALTLGTELVDRIDELVSQHRVRNRSQAVETALAEELQRIARTRLAAECAKLDRKQEKALAEEGFPESPESPDYQRGKVRGACRLGRAGGCPSAPGSRSARSARSPSNALAAVLESRPPKSSRGLLRESTTS